MRPNYLVETLKAVGGIVRWLGVCVLCAAAVIVGWLVLGLAATVVKAVIDAVFG